MIFFEFGPRQDYAGYLPEKVEGEISDQRIPVDSRKNERLLVEYLGKPPRKARKHGSFHKSAYSFFVRDDALGLIERSTGGQILTSPTTIVGRESENIHQFWVTNFVNCLNLAMTIASPSSGRVRGKIGVIKRPVFDEARWDGSDLFVVPQDPSYCYFCTENFITQWKAAKLKGAMFSRYLMDP
ncbi:MAG: hypothetical protein CO182_08230, partial [Lysobacterales bacterium CG_4_9_14_3_um_filter_62_6]